MGRGFHVATDRCYGCKTCTIACANEHLLTPGVYMRRVRQVNVSDPAGHAFVSMSCNHCDDPACVENCPVGAYRKTEDGLVVQDHSICIGCKMCTEVCPFDAPSYDESDSTTYKCDGCIGRQSEGLQPMCTISCPGMNISMDEFDSLSGSFANATSIKEASDTKPNFVVTLDPDITAEMFVGIDDYQETVDRGGEDY